MKKLLYLLALLAFACEKVEQDPRVNIRQQPLKIEIFSVDTASGATTLMHVINYFYNNDSKRFDSIEVEGVMYRFNYDELDTSNKVLLNYNTPTTPHDEIIFETNFFSLTNYNQISASGDTNKSILEYDTNKRITTLSYREHLVIGDFTQTFLYKNDSLFITTDRPSDACITKDTVLQTVKDMSTFLPYLMLVNVNGNCGSETMNILKAMSISNYTNKLPYKIWNNLYEHTYTYKGDSKLRLGEVSIVTKRRTSNSINQIKKVVITY